MNPTRRLVGTGVSAAISSGNGSSPVDDELPERGPHDDLGVGVLVEHLPASSLITLAPCLHM